MRVLLMHPDRDWSEETAITDWFRVFRRDPLPPLSDDGSVIIRDLRLQTLVAAMAGEDPFLIDVGRRALTSASVNDLQTVRYRQTVLRDCLDHPDVVRRLYALTVDGIDRKKKFFISGYARYPTSIQYDAIESLEMFLGVLRQVRDLAAAEGPRFHSTGWRRLFALLQREFADEYLHTVEESLSGARLRSGVLFSARLDARNGSGELVLRQPHPDDRTFVERLVGRNVPGHTFRIHERDEAGARALSDLHNRAINDLANVLAQSADHIQRFFEMLRTELGFYLGCLNMHEKLKALGVATCRPEATDGGRGTLRCRGVYDVALALETQRPPVGNDVNADGKNLLLVTGANQGGKSTFLRSLGIAQLMLQAGMFVGADAYRASMCDGVFTHFKREEDPTMTHGKLDEELARLSGFVDRIRPNAVVLFNESFASTNEREGSDIARQVTTALLERGVKVWFVTHLYTFARSMFDDERTDALFFRAERLPDGTRTFRMHEGEPLETSFGADLYRAVFDAAPAR